MQVEQRKGYKLSSSQAYQNAKKTKMEKFIRNHGEAKKK